MQLSKDSNTFRQRTYQVLEREQSGFSRIINITLILLIILTLVVLFIETVPEIQQQYSNWFNVFEYISIALFSIEYMTRVWSSAEINSATPWRSRWSYMLTVPALIDLLAIAPFYLGLFIQIDTRSLRAVRLLRLLKLTRYSSSLRTLLQVIKNELSGIISALSMLLILIVIASTAMYIVEHKVQPDAFGSIPQAMWWASVTLTTVGYGDVIPVTFLGKTLGIVITILGVGIAALPTGILASGFTTEMQNRRDEFQAKVITSLSDDGQLTHDELHDLEELRIHLGLSIKESKSLIRLSGTGHLTSLSFKHCPHCGKSLTHHSAPH